LDPEGQRAEMKVPELFTRLIPSAMDTQDIVLPTGMKAMRTRGRHTIMVHETPPATYNFKWIANDSPEGFGAGTKYRTVKIALPYLIVFCVFEARHRGRAQLVPFNECFFRNQPLDALDEGELSFPALLNC